jgi:hypothetical protein
MAMIKVGQIYKTKFLRCILAVTYIDPFIEEQENPIDDIYCISPEGEHEIMQRATIEEGDLIAEYPTWQEAVNSKEFKEQE